MSLELEIKEELQIQNVRAVWGKISDFLEEGSELLEISGSQITSIDGSGCQLMAYISNLSKNNPTKIVIRDLSDIARDEAKVLGLKIIVLGENR